MLRKNKNKKNCLKEQMVGTEDKQTSSNSVVKCIDKNKRNKRVLIIVLAIVLTLVSVTSIVLPIILCNKNKEDDSELIQTIEYKETLFDVDKNIDIPVVSTKELTSLTNNISIANQNGISIDCGLKKVSENEYLIKAPNGGYKPGDTYKVKLLDEKISFKDCSYSYNRAITFTVYRNDILDVKQKENVVEVKTKKVYSLIDDTQIFLDKETVITNNIEENSIILLPIYDENGFEILCALKVLHIEIMDTKCLLSVEKPQIEEVYDELEIKGDFAAIYSEEYIKVNSEEQIAKQIEQSPVIQALASMNTATNRADEKPKISVEVKLLSDKVVVEYKIEIPKIFKDLDFVIKGEMDIRIGTRADISVLNGTFDVGAIFSYENKYSFSIKYNNHLLGKGDEDDIKLFKNQMEKLTNNLNEKMGKKEYNISAFSIFLPTPVPALGFSFDVDFVFDVELKAELGITFTDKFSIEVGAKRDTDGINPYFNKMAKTDATDIEFLGSVTAKLGLDVKFSGSVAGLLKAGVSFEIGVYGKIAGSAKVGTLNEFKVSDFQAEPSTNSYYCYAAYFETGIYSSLSLFAEVDLKVYSSEAKFTFLDFELPIFSIGYTQQYDIDLSKDSIVLDSSGKASMPEITIKIKDMFTGEEIEEKISDEEMLKVFDISFKNNKCTIDNECKIISKSSDAEFNDTIVLNLRGLQKFFDVIFKSTNGVPKFEIDTNNRGIIHYELGAIGVSAEINVSKQPVAVNSLELNFERIVNDKEYSQLHPDYTNQELKYNYRENIGEIKDFQIGRLIEVVPEIEPANASYKTLTYYVVKGSQYIVGGENGITTYNKNGVTYAKFRVLEDENAIGNIDGSINWEKEIVIKATTNGYMGEYSNWNIESTNNNRVIASSIPVINYDFTPIIADTNINQTCICAGDEIKFAIDNSTVLPRNASRGIYGQEQINLLSGPAEYLDNGIIRINEDAEVGSQIVVSSEFSGIERQYFLNIVKNAVESIEIISEKNILQPGETIDINTIIESENGSVPTINEASFIIINGDTEADIFINSNDKNTAVLSVDYDAVVGDLIEIVAIIDGQKSNILQFEISKIPVESIEIGSESGINVYSGSVIDLASEILPLDATFKQPKYRITEGKEYATIDSENGKIFINFVGIGGEQIKVIAELDGKISNTLTLIITKTPVQFVQFRDATREYVKKDETIILDAFVNYDATNKEIEYSIVSGVEYAEIIDDRLLITNGVNQKSIRVRATSVDDRNIYTEKIYTIYTELETLTINGFYNTVALMEGEQADIVVTDIQGQVVDNQLVSFELKDTFDNNTDLAFIDENNRINIKENISESIMDLSIVLYAKCDNRILNIYIDIIIPPQVVKLVAKDDETINSIGLKPNETIDLILKENKKANTTPLDDVYLEVIGKGDAILIAENIGYGIKEYTISVQVRDDAATDENVIVYAYYVIGSKTIKSQPFTITTLRLVESIEIINVPDSINIGESVLLQYKTNVEIRYLKPKFMFVEDSYQRYADLDENTGLLSINNEELLVGSSVKVKAVIDEINSEVYEILITDKVREIFIINSMESKNVQYIGEMDFYILNPNGEFVIDTEVKGGDENTKITYYLDAIGQQYLEIVKNKIVVKDVAINSGINATVIASADGVTSNVIVIYIPAIIRTVEDWFNIKDNVNGYYVLANDLDFANIDYVPIEIFGGVIDGAGHSLRNISISQMSNKGDTAIIEENYGILININIKQLAINIDKTEVDSTIYVGGLTAKNYGSIINCTMKSTESNFIGTYIKNSFVGGIAGYNAGNIKKCENWIYIYGFSCVGGIAGYNDSDGCIEKCFNTETISIESYNTVDGVVGYNNGSVQESYNYGKIFDREMWQYINKRG